MRGRTSWWRLAGLVAPALAACNEAPRPAPVPPAVLVSAPKVPPAPAAPATLRVLVGGDLIPHRPSLASSSQVAAALVKLTPLFREADAVIANFEAAVGDATKAPKMVYAAPPSWLSELRGAGVTAISTANNHACDLGEEGLASTLGAAERAGLAALGTDDDDPLEPVVVADDGRHRVCAIAWTTLVNAVGRCRSSPRLAYAPFSSRANRRLAKAFARARASCDATVAIVHGGSEYAPPPLDMKRLVRRVASFGADAVVVHHPHVVAPLARVRADDGRVVPVFASVGNLASNQGESWTARLPATHHEDRRLVCVNGWTRLGMVADLTFRFDDGLVVEHGYHLVWTDNEHARARDVAVPRIESRLLDPEGDRDVVTRLARDPLGPVAVFRDPCWAEGPSADPSACRVRARHELPAARALAPAAGGLTGRPPRTITPAS